MKTLFRVLIILVAASLIGGLMYAGVSASGPTTSLPNFEEGEERPELPEGMEFRPEGGERDEGGLGFPGGVIKAIVLMSIAGGIYSVIVWTGKKAKRTATS